MAILINQPAEFADRALATVQRQNAKRVSSGILNHGTAANTMLVQQERRYYLVLWYPLAWESLDGYLPTLFFLGLVKKTKGVLWGQI